MRFPLCVLVVALACGCEAEPRAVSPRSGQRAVGGGGPAVGRPPSWQGTWRLADGSTLVLRRGGELLRRHGERQERLAGLVVGVPAVSRSGDRLVFSRRVGTAAELVASQWRTGAWSALRVLVADGQPDRAALTPDGRRVVYVAAHRGVAGLWVIGFDGAGRTALTNAGLALRGRALGTPPAGFVPVPHRGPPEVLDDLVRWRAPDGWHEVVLP